MTPLFEATRRGFLAGLGASAATALGANSALGVDRKAKRSIPNPNYQKAGTGNIFQKIMKAVPSGMAKYARKSLQPVLTHAKKRGVSKEQLAYIVATMEHESRMGHWMEEGIYRPSKYTDEYFDRKYSHRRDLGNKGGNDGSRYKGRGFVQLTGRGNYYKWVRRLGKNIVNQPQWVAEPEIAANILVNGMLEGSFTGKKLGDYVGPKKADFVGARKVVNGLDKAQHIADIAERYLDALQ